MGSRHLNYFLLKGLAVELSAELESAVLTGAFSQQKEEMILEFYTVSGKQYYVQAHLQPSFTCLAFPKVFHRARRNSIDLFPEMIGQRVVKAEAPILDRVLVLYLRDGLELVFKLHGNKSNLLLLKNGEVIRLFRNQLKADLRFEWPMAAEACQWHLPDSEQDVKNSYPFASAAIHRFLQQKSSGYPPTADLWEEMIQHLEQPKAFIDERGPLPVFSLFPLDQNDTPFKSLGEGLSHFFRRYQYKKQLGALKGELNRVLQKRKSALVDQIQQANRRLKELDQEQPKSQWADLLMAYMHEVEPGQTEITVQDFYRGKSLTLKIKSGLNPQQQAEKWYKSAQNRHLEINSLQGNIENRKVLLAKVDELLESLEAETDLNQLQEWILAFKPGTEVESSDQVAFREEEMMGHLIWVGKNENQNDLLLKMAHKDDLWLHARDVAGSHVLIRRRPGHPFPKPVIERAAALAAWYSKRRTDSLCPVMYTPRKYVRKIKGGAPGLVRVDREEVLMVKPMP
jgi:predicted ribosome quality control (RQC) complex YloA/Tae2 family protein